MYKLVAVSSALVGLAQALTVNTPAALVQCQPALLSWTDGTAPFYLAVIPGGQPSAAALENLPTQQGETYTWTVDQAAGQSVTIKITDSTGAINYSDQVTIQAGTDTTCGTSSGSSSSGSSSSSAANVATAAAVSPAFSTSTTSSRMPLSTTAASSSSSSSSSSSGSSSSGSKTSGIAGAAAATSSAASTSSTPKNGAASLKAATGLLLGGLVFALAA